MNRLLDSLGRRIVRLLQRRGPPVADRARPSPDLVPDSSLHNLQAAAVGYRIAIGPQAARRGPWQESCRRTEGSGQ